MQALLTSSVRTRALVPVLRRSLGTSSSAQQSGSSVSFMAETGMASVLGVVVGAAWMGMAFGQYSQLDSFNSKIAKWKSQGQ